jgi:hypothetical protein
MALTYREIRRSVRRASQDYFVSKEARDIIALTLHAIVTDPSSQWRREDVNRREEVERDMVRRLPEFISRVAGNSEPRGMIDTFSLLHNFGALLDRICPFEKIR